MNAIDISRLGKRYEAGIRLFYEWKKAEIAQENAKSERYMEEAEEWKDRAIEDAEPWPGLQALLEPLGRLKPEEQALTRNWIRHAHEDRQMALICFAVQLHRIQEILESLASTPAKKRHGGRHKGDGEIDDTVPLDEMKKLWDAGNRSLNGIATLIVQELGTDILGNSDSAKIRRLSRKFKKLYSLDSNPN